MTYEVGLFIGAIIVVLVVAIYLWPASNANTD